MSIFFCFDFIIFLLDINEDSGKFILKMRDFKNIFDGLVDFIPIHEKFLANLTCNQGLENFLLAISQLVRNN